MTEVNSHTSSPIFETETTVTNFDMQEVTEHISCPQEPLGASPKEV